MVNIAVLSRAPAEENPLFRDPYFRFFFDSAERPPAQPQMSAGGGPTADIPLVVHPFSFFFARGRRTL